MSSRQPSNRPIFKGPRFVCPHGDCGAFAQQVWVQLLRHDDWGNFDRSTTYLQTWPDEVPDGQDPCQWYAAECGSCQQMSIWLNRTMIYPTRGQLGGAPHPDLPDAVCDIYLEAAQVAVVSRRAGAALARAGLEKLLRHLDVEAPKSASLDKRIERIRSKVSASLLQMLEVIRVSGNGAVHIDDEPDEIVVRVLDDDEGPGLVEMMLETINDLADELITKPKRAGDLFALLPDHVLAKYRSESP
jgi:hypothetical protein